jgi:hypothetical protein
MPILFLPTTAPGRWAAFLSIGLFILLFLSPLIVNLFSIITGHVLSDSEILLTVIGTVLVVLAAATLVTGTLAMLRFKERSVVVILGTVFSLVYLLFAIDTIIA